MNFFEDMSLRGLVYDQTDGLIDHLNQGTITAYTGFDPTGDSLHVGSLVPIISLARMQRAGHHVIALAGGGTGLIGDPSGKHHERQLLSADMVEHNVNCIKKQLSRFLDFDSTTNPAKILNNASWLGNISFLEFLRDVGKHFTVNYMTHKESVKSRIDREDGISFTEFSYMLLQAYDFYYLSKHHGCTIQSGGSDQWGNITAGIELIRRMDGKKVYGLVYPLVTKSDGSKFGKTEGGNIWLDAQKTSPYEFYQFWLNTTDEDVVAYLKWFTFLDHTRIHALHDKLIHAPEKRDAQRALAREMTKLVHGESALAEAEKATAALFDKGKDIKSLSLRELQNQYHDVQSKEISKDSLSGDGVLLTDLIHRFGLQKSKSDARRMIEQGGVRVNNDKVSELQHRLDIKQSLHGKFVLLQCGKKNKLVLKVV